jgi:hypothetical protein
VERWNGDEQVSTQTITPAVSKPLVPATESGIALAVRTIANRIRKTQSTQMDAIRDMWKALDLTKAEITTLAMEGLQGRLSGALHNRGGAVSVSVDVVRHPHATVQVSVTVLNECYPTSRGTVAVINFTAEDCDEVLDGLKAQAFGIQKRIALVERAKGLILEHGVRELSQVPKDELEALVALQ